MCRVDARDGNQAQHDEETFHVDGITRCRQNVNMCVLFVIIRKNLTNKYLRLQEIQHKIRASGRHSVLLDKETGRHPIAQNKQRVTPHSDIGYRA